VLFSQELREDVLAGEITVSFRLWKRPKVKTGGRYPVGAGLGLIEVDSIELIPSPTSPTPTCGAPGNRTGRRCGVAPRTRVRLATARCYTGWSSTPSRAEGRSLVPCLDCIAVQVRCVSLERTASLCKPLAQSVPPASEHLVT
jgi:hypothetical protein